MFFFSSYLSEKVQKGACWMHKTFILTSGTRVYVLSLVSSQCFTFLILNKDHNIFPVLSYMIIITKKNIVLHTDIVVNSPFYTVYSRQECCASVVDNTYIHNPHLFYYFNSSLFFTCELSCVRDCSKRMGDTRVD